ncbi:MAG: hypothetical protein EOM87_09175, partial [Clostridia bacterium]|nr:hypothetical protein [Clostridia bacterium]
YTTVPYSVNYAQRLGIKIVKSDENLALALGGLTEGVTQREICGAYMTYANGGNYSKPTFVNKITDKYGNILYMHNKNEQAATNAAVSYMISDMLKDTVKNGTAKKLSNLKYDVAAKTGTVAAKVGNSDAWCALYTSLDTLCVWQGNSSMKSNNMLDNKITGGSYPTVMARQILSNLYKSAPDAFRMPESLKNTAFDKYSIENDHSLRLAGDYTPDEFIIYDLAPTENTVPVSEYFSLPNVNNFEVKNESGSVEITFDALPFYSYNIYRQQLMEKTLINTISGKNGKTVLSDTPRSGIAIYSVVPFFVSKGQLISGSQSATKGIYYTGEPPTPFYKEDFSILE